MSGRKLHDPAGFRLGLVVGGVACLSTLACHDIFGPGGSAASSASSSARVGATTAPELPGDAVLERVELAVSQRGPLTSSTAFDLVPTLDGALLIWAERLGGSFRAQRLSKLGQLRGPPEEVIAGDTARGQVGDLVADSGALGVVVAWLERIGEQARASSSLIQPGAKAEVVDLGGAWHTHKHLRGNLALAVGGDTALVFVRGPREACAEGQRDCFGFALHRLSGSGASQARGLPLSVPVPCADHSVHVALTRDRWHYAVCTLEGHKPVSTVFNIQFEPEYAQADQFLPGCRPRGLVELEARVWLSGDCDGMTTLVSVDGAERAQRQLGRPRVVCRGGGPVLVGTSWEYRFQNASKQLQELLPASLRPELARAVWTGRALLVASENRGQLRLVGYQCTV